MVKLYKVPAAVALPGWRRMKKKDVFQVTALLKSYLEYAPLCLSLKEVRPLPQTH